ncbi:hypothetical protein [Sediminimonas qiaohouensis]|uniref:hypothetical protein n=1 Tax=Sediminimonas qiaohouensis TaxID=552061 RepID=UPI00047E4256|nr:hypothetical protein [Sediminimonas qiaohouensis]
MPDFFENGDDKRPATNEKISELIHAVEELNNGLVPTGWDGIDYTRDDAEQLVRNAKIDELIAELQSITDGLAIEIQSNTETQSSGIEIGNAITAWLNEINTRVIGIGFGLMLLTLSANILLGFILWRSW